MADTPINPKVKAGFYADQAVIPGRYRIPRNSNTKPGYVEFLSQNGQAELIVENMVRLTDHVEALTLKLDEVIEVLSAALA